MSAAPQSTSGWHISPERVSAYLADRVDIPTAASIEAHVLDCSSCRAAVAAASEAEVAVGSWNHLQRRIDDDLSNPAERLAVRLGFADRDVRILAPSQGLQLSWLLAAAVALLCAAGLTRTWGVASGSLLFRTVYLVIAPLVPLVAVVSALGTSSEPAAEIARCTSASRLRIGALRALTAMLASILVAMAVSTLLPGSWSAGVVWLCPALALCGLGALVASQVPSSGVISGLAMIWMTGVMVSSILVQDRLAAFRPGPQMAYLAIAAVAAVGIACRPTSFDLGSIR